MRDQNLTIRIMDGDEMSVNVIFSFRPYIDAKDSDPFKQKLAANIAKLIRQYLEQNSVTHPQLEQGQSSE